MFIRGFKGMRGLGEYQARQPQDWKIDNWIGQPTGGGLQPALVPVNTTPAVSTATVVGGGLGLAALAALAWWYFKK
jgi:hypothetical protein